MRASNLGQETLPCPCKGHATVHRASNGKDARLYQIQIDHCPHEAAAHDIRMHMMFLLNDKQLSKLELDLDEPGRKANPPALRADNGTIAATHVYGDRVVEMNWSRDSYRQNDGTLVPQPTESYFIAVRPKTSDDRECASSSKEPRVGSAPACR